jgi:transposase
MAITYQENWIVESASELPVFIREEMLGAASAENVDGRTEYRTQEIRAGGDVLVGTYDRDGTRHGTFRMMRAGAPKQLEEKSQKELQEQAVRRGASSSQLVRQEVRQGIEKALEARGVSVEKDRLDELVDEWARLYQSGLRESEIGQRLVEQVLREAGDAP